MRLLWTLSNWKRTGPVVPSLDAAAALQARGHEVHVAVGQAPEEHDENTAAETLRGRGLSSAALGVPLTKHRSPRRNLRAVRALRTWIRDHEPDAVVTTLRRDHMLVARACRGRDARPVHRLWFLHEALRVRRWEIGSLRRAAGIWTFGDRAEERLRRLGVAADRLHPLDPPMDVDRLHSAAHAGAGARARFGLPGDAVVFGLVARMQRHRRFGLLFEALERLRERCPQAHVVLLGRGTHEDEVVRTPIREQGLKDVVTCPGYLRGSSYAGLLAACDVQLFLMPGSDPTCRALREGMALGVPSLVLETGLLPWLVAHERTGLVVEPDPEALAAGMARLAGDLRLREAMGRAARQRATERFDAARVAAHMERHLLEAQALRAPPRVPSAAQTQGLA